MGKSIRHLKALMRKNAILWYRTPFCACFEIAAPVVMMIVLCYLRTMVPRISTDQSGLLDKKGIAYPGVVNVNGTWWPSTDYNYVYNALNIPFTIFGNYSEKNNHDPANYQMEYDWQGPQFYSPSHCLRNFDYMRPKAASPVIGIIGNQTDITDSISKYYAALRKVQHSSAGRFVTPLYVTQNFGTQQEFDDYISSPDYKTEHKGVCMGLQDFSSGTDNNYTFSIHFPDQKIGFSQIGYAQGVPDQKNPVWLPFTSAPDVNSYVRYQHNGMSFMQNILAFQILANKRQDTNALITLLLQPLPTDSDVYDPFQQALGLLLPLFLLLGYIPPVYNLTFKIVREKESRAKETMRIMGMTDLPYWLSWFIFYTVINTVVTTLAWAILMFNVITYSQPMYLWIFFWLYGEAVFGQIIFLQSMFTGSKYAGIVSTVIYFSGVLVNKAVLADGVTRTTKLIASLLPQVAIMQGSIIFANYEGTGVGLNNSTATVLYDEYSFDSALYMLLVDFFLFFGLGLYMDKVIPSDFGQRLSPCFLCTPSYYRCCRSRRQRGQLQPASDSEALMDREEDDNFEMAQMPAENYESPNVMSKRLESTGDYLRIQDLQKTFSGGFRAVRGVNVKMYDSQIFTLLGHNGAGKSTIISMLTGLIKKSAGSARCYDVDLFEEMDEVREFMGVCPQHDVLFELLTPREHLEIFYDFKGGDPARAKSEIDSLIADVGLTIDQHKCAYSLSGGNKRKLSVCIALCGNSRFVLLDEPTSGMDLGARRNLWDMLKSYKKDRIVILTTHYMDEADVLGDRIGIMVQGQLKCIGSSLFLKNRFGIGYKITFVKKRRRSHPGLEQFLQSYFEGVQKAGEVHEEISFVIPKTQAQNFGGFFETLDQRLDEFEIRSYGVSMSNLEDVFLKINQEFAPELFGDLKSFDNSKSSGNISQQGVLPLETSQKQDFAKSIGNSTNKTGSRVEDSEQVSDNNSQASSGVADVKMEDADQENLIRGSSCMRSCTASGAKRFVIYKRDWCGLLCQIVIPLTLVLFGLYLTSGPTKLTQSPPKTLSTGWYPYKQRILFSEQPYNMTGDGGDIMGSQLAAMLPNATEAFEVTYVGNLTYLDFYNQVYATRNEGPLLPYRYGSYQIYKANNNTNLYQIVSYLNVTSQDVTAMYPQYLYTAILRVATGDPELNFSMTTTPFPIYQMFIDLEEAAGAFDFVFMTAIALALIPCVMVQFILNERELQLKHQQLLSGMSLAGYWTSNILFDIFMAYVPISLIIMLTFVFDKTYDGVWVLFLLYPPAVVPFTYVTSFLFSSDINAQIFTLFLHFLSGGLFTCVVFVLQMIPVTMAWGDALRWVFCIFPSFCVTHGILFAASGSLIVNSRNSDDSETAVIPRKITGDVWAWENLKGDAAILVLHFFFSLMLLTLIELEVYSFFSWCPCLSCRNCHQRERRGPVLIKDDDVIAEEKRIDMQDGSFVRSSFVPQEPSSVLRDSEALQKNPHHKDCIRVHNFQKIYEPAFQSPTMAVRQASFGLDYGECFALLGVNGAGKSTTFKSLTRDITPTMGEITIQGFNIQTQFAEARKLIGYCPQYDAIFPKLTVEETIKFYALIKGIRTSKINSVVEKAIRDLNLKDHRHKFAGTLSGGNKRKLSVAMALIGNPPIILLDEPSAGMDPEARRFMWQVVEKISQRDKKSAVLLTTHSMEEAEALSTKLGIMVRGGIFRCMGSSQHIKNKFGVGYEVEIKVRKSQYHELQDLAHQIGFKFDLQQKVTLQGAIEQCAAAHFEDLILDQIRKNGMGADLASEAEIDAGKAVRLRNLLEYLKSLTYGFSIIRFLTRHFRQVEVLEQCGEFFKLRVPKEGKTIGWLFGQLEHEKKSLGIQEYSVSQTTLEQIFQAFANQSISSDKAAFTFTQLNDQLILLNPDRRMTEDQERLSQRGLSFVSERAEQQLMDKPKLIDFNDGHEGPLLLPAKNFDSDSDE